MNLPLILPKDDGDQNIDHTDIATCSSTDDALSHVSDEDPDHDPFTDYPATAEDDSESVDDDDTESGDA